MVTMISSMDAPPISLHSIRWHRRTLGALWAIYALVSVIKVGWLAVNADNLTLMWSTLLNRLPNPYPWMSMFHLGLLLAMALFVVTAIFSFLAAMALTTRTRHWRHVVITAGVLALVNGPLGLALGVYTLIFLIPRNADEGYERLATAA